MTFRWKALSCLFCPLDSLFLTLCFTAVFLLSNPLCSIVSRDYLIALVSWAAAVHTNERSIYGKIDHFLGPLVLSKAACSTALRKIFLLRSFDWGWGAWHHLTAFILLVLLLPAFAIATKYTMVYICRNQEWHICISISKFLWLLFTKNHWEMQIDGKNSVLSQSWHVSSEQLF